MNRNALQILVIVLFSLFLSAGCMSFVNVARPNDEEATTAETVTLTNPLPIVPAATLTGEATPQVTSTLTTLPIPTSDSSAVQPGDEEAVISATVALTKPSPTTPSITLTRAARPQAGATPTPVPTIALEETVDLVCQQPPQAFNLFDALGIRWMADLRFESEELVTFEGWTDRPEPTILPRTPEPTTEPGMAINVSSRIFLTAGQLDLSNGALSPRPLAVSAPLANPCGEACPLEVLDQSPNGEWQLIQVNDWLRAQMGLWLVSAETEIRVVPYVPAYPSWQWAEDNSLLWLVYSFEEYGGETLVIHLDNPPIVYKSQVGGLLDPVMYWSSFAPADNMAFAVPAPEIDHDNMEQVFTIALKDDPERASGVWDVPGIVSVAWNEATRSTFAQGVTPDGITFQELPGGLSLTIPNETLATLLPSFTSAADNLPTGLSAPGNWAISPSGGKLVLLPNPAVLWVFDCAPDS